MQALRCENPHPKLPGHKCNSLIKIEGFGTVECTRCRMPIHFDFQREGTEAVDKELVHG